MAPRAVAEYAAMTRVRFALGIVLAITVSAMACTDGGGDGEPSASAERSRVRVVSQNLLHGIACPPDSDGCDLPDRVALFARQLDEAGCPELVGVQEANEQMVGHLRTEIADTCDGRYEVVWDDDPGLDREVVLTTLPVLGSQRTRLAGPLRTAFSVRVAAEVGIVDFVSTHLASGSDDRPCDEATCPPPCTVDETVNACQGRQVAQLAIDGVADGSVVIIGGDLNAVQGDPAIEAIEAEGFVDTHLEAGNPECDPATGDQCTSGRADDSLADLTDPTSRQTERIDFLLVGGDRDCTTVDPTGLFNGDPALGPLAFPADHTGVQANVECATTQEQRDAAPTATVTTAPTTSAPPGGKVDPATLAAITDTFETLFGGEVTDPEQKLAVLEDAAALREFFLESFEAQQAIASRIRVRIDDVSLTGADRARVTYTLLLDGAAVLDHLPGEAVKVGDQWLVTRRSFCDVSTQGVTALPPACR